MSLVSLFIAGRSRVEAALQSLQQTGVTDDGSVTRYLDPKTGHEWLLSQLWDRHGGPPYLRRGAEPALSEILEFISAAENDTDVAAAVLHVEGQPGGYEHYSAVLAALEAMLEANPTQRQLRNILVALAWLPLEGGCSNLRPVVGKSFAQIERDYQEFVALGRRAGALRVLAERRSGLTIDCDEGMFDR
jgi:hypothetical protein